MCTFERTLEAINMNINKYVGRTSGLERSKVKLSLGTWGGGGFSDMME